MKKYIWISFLLISCGARKSSVEKYTNKVDTKESTDLSQKIENTTQSESTFNFSKLSENQNFSIKGGEPYTLNYKGIIYSGSSAIEISNNKVETKIKSKTTIKTTYKSETTYKTETRYQTITTYKNKQTDRKSYPWYLLVAIGFFLKILIGLAWSKIKVSNPYLSILNKFKNKL